MIKKVLTFLLFSALAFGQSTTTVTGNLRNLGTGTVSSNSFVRFYLRGCAGNQPRINGTAIIAPTQGNVYYFDFVPSGGTISGTLYSTRDASGNGNGAIECGGSFTSVWYGMVPFLNGKAGPETPVHAKASATLDISNVTPISSTPTVTAPTGDTTYMRLDAGNSPETGNWTFNGSTTFAGNVSASSIVSAKDIAHTCDASFYSGSDDGAKITAALADSNCTYISAFNLVTLTGASPVTIPNNKWVLMPCGLYVGATTAFSIGSNAGLIGVGQNCTIISTNSATANIVDVPNTTQWWNLGYLSIRSEVARSAGAGIGCHGGNGVMERVVVYPVFDGMWCDTATTAGNNKLNDVQFTNGTGSPSAGSGGTWHCGFRNGGGASGTVAGNTLHHVTVAMNTAFTDAGICAQDGTDTLTIEGNSQAVANIGGSDSVALHLETINGGGSPSNVQIVNSTFEGGVTKNGVVIDAGLNVKFSSVTVQSSLKGIVVNSCVGCSFIGGTLHLNQQHGIHLVSAFYTNIAGNHFSDNSQGTTNTFDDILVAAGVTNFQIRGNFHADFSSTGKICKWGVEIAAGASNNYIVDDVNPGSCGTGAVSDSGTGINKRVMTLGNNFNFGASSISLMGSGSGTATIQVPSAAGTPSLTLPTVNGTFGLQSGTQTFFEACSGTASPATTLALQWFGGACTSSATAAQAPTSTAGTLLNMRVKCGTAGTNASSGAFTLNKNGSTATALTCTVGTGTTCSDTTHTVAAAAGDTWQVFFTTQAAETLANCAVSWEKQ